MAAGRTSKGLLALTTAVLALVAGGCGGDPGGGSNTLTWFIFNEPSASPQTAAEKCSKESGGEYEIEFEFLPADADGQREQLVRRLGAEDDSIDLIGMDVIWTGEFASAEWIVPVPEATAQVVSKDVFPSVLETAKFEGELYAAPLWSNTELLWYRSDLVKRPPKTWDEMIDEAESLKPGENLIQVQANKYEGLVVWFNQMVASAGGQILAGPQELALPRAETERALEVMGRLSTSDAADPAITTSQEDPNRLAFQTGSSAFMINYPFVYPSAEAEAPDIFKVMKAAKYPAIDPGTPSAPPLGGVNLGVSAFSQNQDLAWKAVECLVGAENQIATASAGGLPPVREDLYDSKEIKKVYPGFSQIIRKSIADAAARPSESPAYQDISLAIQTAVHPTTDIDPEDPSVTYDDLRELLEQAINREGLL
ncbi:MAG: extracellular solute-binding protein [Solirubrobacterales bacterium]|nr:extracellular solute-binding protein [Solirubrobacterales bacterium]